MVSRSTNEEKDSSSGEPRRRTDLAARLSELCDGGNKRSAVKLARSVLASASVRRVSVDSSTVTVETEHFTGSHEWRTNAQNDVVIEQGGEYRCTLDGVDLTFSTATMNETAYRRALTQLEAKTGRGSSEARDASESSDTTAESTADDGSRGEFRSWIRRILGRIG